MLWGYSGSYSGASGNEETDAASESEQTIKTASETVCTLYISNSSK